MMYTKYTENAVLELKIAEIHDAVLQFSKTAETHDFLCSKQSKMMYTKYTENAVFELKTAGVKKTAETMYKKCCTLV